MVGALLGCFVLASFCWLALWDVFWGTRHRPPLKNSDCRCFDFPECICDVVAFGDIIWLMPFVGF